MKRIPNIRLARGLIKALGASAIILLAPHAAKPFAGEDFLKGNPWHHEELSEEACKAKGFTASAADDVAWHADYVDSYLYNPLWWIPGGISRFKVSLASFDHLKNVHFDDNFSAQHIQRTWRRYLSGTMAGLIWAAERNDVAAARNILGISLHAIQDFNSHSNWIDAPDRRNKTWLEFPKAQRDNLAIYAGAYELPEQLGIKHHGKITPACTILRQGAVQVFLEPGCSAFSPLHNAKICDMYDECKRGTPIQPSLFGLTVPNNVLYAAPPGMNLDARWSAGIGVRVRGLTDINGDQAFTTARNLALRTSEQWLAIVEGRMNAIGKGAFWNKVKTDPSASQPNREQQYENFSKFPYQFISAGPYPPNINTPEEEYYLRVLIRTANELNAGTDADIYLEAGGKRYLLDYMHRANPIIAYNDLERNDLQVYTVGPFTSLPSSITFFNDSADAGEVLTALGRSFVNAITGLVDSIGNFLLSLVGGHADKVGGAKHVFQPAELRTITSAGKNFSLNVNGGDEGKFRLDCNIRRTGETAENATYSIKIVSLKCLEESDWDRGSNSDEPYVLSLVVPLPGATQKRLFGPFNDVDKNETRTINYTYSPVTVNKNHGMISVPISIWESDDESANSRQQQLDKFANEADGRTDDEKRGFLDALGAALAADWKIGSLDVYAFSRGGVVKAGSVLSRPINEWVEGKKRRTYALNAAGLKTYAEINSASLDVSGPIFRIQPPGSIVRPPAGIRIPPPGLLFW
jgi:hypothetical protein